MNPKKYCAYINKIRYNINYTKDLKIFIYTWKKGFQIFDYNISNITNYIFRTREKDRKKKEIIHLSFARLIPWSG